METLRNSPFQFVQHFDLPKLYHYGQSHAYHGIACGKPGQSEEAGT